MSKEVTEEKKSQVQSKVFPVKTLKYNGVPIEVKPLRWGRVCEAIEFLWDFFLKAAAGELSKEFLFESKDSLNRYLDECTTIPDVPEWTIADLPPDAVYQILDVFLEHTLQPGNFQALAQKWKNKLGVTITAPTQSQGPS